MANPSGLELPSCSIPTLNAARAPNNISKVTNIAAAEPVELPLACMARVGVVANIGPVAKEIKNIATPRVVMVS